MILSCNNISKSFGTDVIIKSCSFNIEDHEKAAIVGINGAGKSTLLKIITGIEPALRINCNFFDLFLPIMYY